MTDIGDKTIPRFTRGVRTRYDEARERWMILGPERILVPRGPGAEIAQLIDGTRSVAQIVERLLADYDADEQIIRTDTTAFLQDLVGRGYIELTDADN